MVVGKCPGFAEIGDGKMLRVEMPARHASPPNASNTKESDSNNKSSTAQGLKPKNHLGVNDLQTSCPANTKQASGECKICMDYEGAV
jgi:hypothetical protein